MRPFGDLPGDDPERDAKRAAEEDRKRAEDRRETAAALEAAGIELDPTPPGTPPSRRPRPSERSQPSARPRGSRSAAGHRDRWRGSRGTALGVALSRAGWPIHAVASRDSEPARAIPLASSPSSGLRRRPGSRRGGRAHHPRRPRRCARAPCTHDPDVRRPGDDPHQRGARCRGPRTGAGRRDPGRVVPPAGGLRRHRAGSRRAPRGDCGHRRRRSAAGVAGRDGGADRRARRPAHAGLEARLPRRCGPRGGVVAGRDAPRRTPRRPRRRRGGPPTRDRPRRPAARRRRRRARRRCRGRCCRRRPR